MSLAPSKKMSRFLPGSEEFSYSDFPFYWLARVHLIYSQKMERILKRLGTDIPARRVLLMLKLHGTLSVSDLSTHAIIKLPTMTRIVHRMRADGLLETRTNALDARITDVSITPAGDALVERIQQATGKLFQVAYQGLTETQIKKLNATLEVMFNNFSDM